jgi:hypothetical protein
MPCAKCGHIFSRRPTPNEVLVHHRACDPQTYAAVVRAFIRKSKHAHRAKATSNKPVQGYVKHGH